MVDAPNLSHLIRTVERSGKEELARVGIAVEIAKGLTDTGDALVDHFVDEARSAGYSWAQIGSTLGVSKQAAQQRFVPKPDQLLSRFTARARAALDAAAEHARRMQHNYIGTEHLLLALFDDPESVAAKVLASFDGVEQKAVEERVRTLIGMGPQPVEGDPLFTPRGMKSLELSLREALKLGHNYIGTEHVLLGLIDLREGVAYDILEDLGVKKAEVVKRVVDALSGYKATS